MHRRDRVLAWTLPIVMIGVALTQIGLAHTRDLTPWKGGGFGMFASVDLLSYRPITAEFDTNDGPVPVDVHDFGNADDHANKLYINARGLPDERRLRLLTELMAQAEWVVTDEIAEFDAWSDEARDRPLVRRWQDEDEQVLEVYGIDVEVWRVTCERGSGFIRPELIIERYLPYGDVTALNDASPRSAAERVS